uniref:Uncharacterized protein n=1 Tax=Oryza rufipogon TaxID=4529 RepID=A0A0E0RDK6_ORYRU
MTLNSSKLIIPSPSLSKTLSILSHSSWPASCCKPNLLITLCSSRGLMNPSPSPSNTLKASSSSSQLACFSSNRTLVALPVDTEPKRCYYHIDIAMRELCSCFGFRMFRWACAVCVVLVTEKKIQRLEQRGRNTFVIWTSRLLVNIFPQKHSDKNENNK